MYYLQTCRDVPLIHSAFLRETKYTARKNYECCECGKTIKKAEQYFYIVGKWDDDEIQTFRMCLNCNEIWNKIVRVFEENGEDAGVVYTMLGEAIYEAIEEGYLDKDSQLAKNWFAEE